jgi:hypothetical protein
VAHGRAARCRTFSWYLVLALIGDSLTLFVPQHFWTRDFWEFKKTLLDGLMFGVGVEVSYLTFRPLAAQKAMTGAAIGVGLLATMLAPSHGQLRAARDRLDLGCAVLFTTIAVLVAQYHVRQDHLLRVITLGMVVTAWASVGIRLLTLFELPAEFLGRSVPFVLLAVVSCWTWAALREPSGDGWTGT